MNVDKWAWCGQFLLINGLGAVIVLYWASDGSCCCIMYRLGIGLRSPYKGDFVRFFVKLWIPMNGTHKGYRVT